MKRLFAIRHLVVLAVAAATTLMVSCFKDDIIELPSGKPSLPTASEYIAFQADAQWADEDVISRNAATRNRVGKHDLISEDGELSLPMGVYVEDGICGTTDNGKTRGAVLSAIGNSFTVWASLTNGDTTELFFPAEGVVFEDDGTSYKSDPAYFWPGAGTFSFTAVANAPDTGFVPNLNTAGTALESFTYTVPTDATAQNDIVLATLKDVDGGANATQALNFHHIMSAVQFKVGETMAAGKIKSITLNNIYTEGTYSISTNTWVPNTTSKGSYSVIFSTPETDGTYEPNGKTGTIINDNAATFMLVPQQLADDAQVVVEFIYDNLDGQVKVLSANISKHNIQNSDGTITSIPQEWSISKTNYYEISISENYNLTIIPSGEVLDAHYIMTDITINVEGETDEPWTLEVSSTGIVADENGEIDDVSIEFCDKLNNLITSYNGTTQKWENGYWIGNIIDRTGSTESTSVARGSKTLTGSTRGTYNIKLFLPENVTGEDRTVTLKLYLDSAPKSAKIYTLYQKYPYWDFNKDFGWERVENTETGAYGFNWTRLVCYVFTYNLDRSHEGIMYDRDYYNNIIDPLIEKYNASGFVSKREWYLSSGLSSGYRPAVIIDYTKINEGQYMTMYDRAAGLENTKAMFEAANIMAFENALKNIMKIESGQETVPAFRLPNANELNNVKLIVREPTSNWWGTSYENVDSPYTDGNGNVYNYIFAEQGSIDDMSGILTYIIQRNNFDIVKTKEGNLNMYALDYNADNIKWYLPAVGQYDDPVLSFATGNTAFSSAEYWSSTLSRTVGYAFIGNGDEKLRSDKYKVVVQRKNIKNITAPATVTVDNSSIAGEENGSTNNWLE